ncbi:monofunctional biosynthetic peptidoglycan transglycosylase [Rhodovulum marinum]|uniref:Biosynthetic peptidoglycan transglycosylase n=1 Tax=Rhodovulum marinum TaxID=320662 RepID=A0A4R2PW00_9RHOB|nr:monofunctional biosynthetic peptidoglycan transglycosylase [Rhodovulum marinum]TCP40210.1 monofunctional biosynthetic peptidoglycan transglycosylase [Rhodovulum marinum]
MARQTKSRSGKGARKKPAPRKRASARPALPLGARLRRWGRRGAFGGLALVGLAILAPAVLNPPTTWTMLSEARRLGGIEHHWIAADDIAPVMLRATVAAEDANFCRHWGFDMRAIRGAIEAGGRYGASTISQQTVKNVYLWQGRSWPRKALEAVITPGVELAWSKRRILEVYLNVAEFGEGVFGIDAAARHYFGVPPAQLSAAQAGALAAVLPDPKGRNAARLTPALKRRAAQILDGAATIRADGRSDCFES